MRLFKITLVKAILGIGLLCATSTMPILAQEANATAPKALEITAPTGSFVDQYGTIFTLSLCGDKGTDLCAVLTHLAGKSATAENLAYVGTQVMQIAQTAPNQWQGPLSAGGMSADATITQTGPDTIEIQGCRAAILCQTLAYTRA